ncbi:hypothetical protein, partial [Ferrovibrio sp.]|uniref:hypothetical protein n=1 Tax=Ferrovibrio sp. TaxID=1917215 RepID=UPI00311EC5C5
MACLAGRRRDWYSGQWCRDLRHLRAGTECGPGIVGDIADRWRRRGLVLRIAAPGLLFMLPVDLVRCRGRAHSVAHGIA